MAQGAPLAVRSSMPIPDGRYPDWARFRRAGFAIRQYHACTIVRRDRLLSQDHWSIVGSMLQSRAARALRGTRMARQLEIPVRFRRR